MLRSDTVVTKEVDRTAGRTAVADDTCALREVVDLIGDKWSTSVLVALETGPRRFSELERATGASRRMLTLTLRNLERNGLVSRTVYAEVPPKVVYATTPLVRQIREPLEALSEWLTGNRENISRAQRRFDEYAG